MAVTSPHILTVAPGTNYDLRKLSSYVAEGTVARCRFIDEPLTFVNITLATLEAALQASLNATDIFSNGYADTSFKNTNGTFTPGNGGTVAIGTVGAGISTVLVLPSGAITTGNLTAPAAPIDGQRLTVILGPTNVITTFALVANAGQTVLAGSSAGAVNTSKEWMYRLSNTTWYRVR